MAVRPVPAADETFSGRLAREIDRKMTCGTRYGIFSGRAYSRVPGERVRHLFNVLGVNTRQCATVGDPDKGQGYRSVSREFSCYVDIPGVAGGRDEPFDRYSIDSLHDQGNLHWLQTKEGREIGSTLRNVQWLLVNCYLVSNREVQPYFEQARRTALLRPGRRLPRGAGSRRRPAGPAARASRGCHHRRPTSLRSAPRPAATGCRLLRPQRPATC